MPTQNRLLNFRQQNDDLRRQNGGVPRQIGFSLLLFFLLYNKLQ